MHFLKFLTVWLFICLFAYPLYAAGNFYIGEDEGGAYFQTDHHGGWYIDKQDLNKFKIGDTGRYDVKADRDGTFIKTEKHGKFYVDWEAKKQLENEIATFNTEQEKNWEKLRSDEVQRNKTETQNKNQEENRQDNMEAKELKVTVSHEYRYPYGIWGDSYWYGRYGAAIHHKIESPQWIDKPAIKKHHSGKRPSPHYHRIIPYKASEILNTKN
jgi:hypothetical protein